MSASWPAGLARPSLAPAPQSARAAPGWLMPADAADLIAGRHGNPFALLGPHAAPEPGEQVLRAFLPGAEAAWAVARPSCTPFVLERVHPDGFFAGAVPRDAIEAGYRLQAVWPGSPPAEFEDPYRFAPLLGDVDTYLLAEGTHRRIYEVLGAHPRTLDGVAGTVFAVWAPNARRVSVVGDFNCWDGRRHPMRFRPECGVWELFLPGTGAGDVYKFEILAASGDLLLKADPFAREAERPPATASRVTAMPAHVWQDETWMAARARRAALDAPLSVYEVHLGSWRRHSDGRPLSYRELAETLVPYVAELGFSHVELMPVSEYPFDGSWGYQPCGLFAPTSRFGTPDDFRLLVDRFHQAGVGVILDWVPGHFPNDPHGLARFDGTCLYEHEDERRGRHRDWDTLIYNYGRTEVANFLIANALYWVREFHIDGLRIDAVASMLYLDYSRQPGDWIPNAFGDNRNLEAIAFLRDLNHCLHTECPGVVTIAEESTSWPLVSRPPDMGGLGFSYKWNMGWMNDTLHYMRHDPVHRRYHHSDLTFGMLYAYSENFMLPLSHDEVVHGKGSLLDKMPGDGWQKFANLRSYLAFMFGYPGKKLLFMGAEIAQGREWDHDGQLDWPSLDHAWHAGALLLVRDLNRLYRELSALHARDCEPGGFAWIDCQDADQNVIAFQRRGLTADDVAIVVCNFSPVVREGYRIGVPVAGLYREVLNTDAGVYGGSGAGNFGQAVSDAVPWHGHTHSLALTLPPLATLVLVPQETGPAPERKPAGDS